ncbi:pyrroline-5-carboxylate dehydrogenase rocA [Suillus fuscotomentosus]|uniref:Pyrroline-5-carboxylate dehydrogenase rocA n=1 Tax=Suillus fuscotomentosus TaxID=1912939 RepID=A0AAD4HIS9_9AGAM|nr:pyrroline-5-carboxylate dehydrogenase rocA [Suillus fuscotomentosus]KAG1897716.1 pyrroline-5-carboxylate dehydrogenase rocA [Suillus fuscotomentosus]
MRQGMFLSEAPVMTPRATPYSILTKDPESITMKEEISDPVITVYVYDDANYEKTLELIDNISPNTLTGSRRVALKVSVICLRNTAGNVCYHEECTGAVVCQQPFGGGRSSETNDKAIFYQFLSARRIKENFVDPEDF